MYPKQKNGMQIAQNQFICCTRDLRYGVTVTEADIGQIKARGNANNDWQCTVDLINEAGVSPPAELDKVGIFKLEAEILAAI